MSVDTKIKTSAKGILVVEDNMLLSLVYEMQIHKLGHNLLGKVTTGEMAIEAVKELHPDLVIMDIILEGQLDGIEAMEKIREFSKVPVIYISGNSDSSHTKRALKTNYLEYLIKPVNNKELIRSIRNAFS